MLNLGKSTEKTHEMMMEEIYSEIPIYSNEWTNYNPSDPGITMLENLSAFQLLQYNQLDNTSNKVKQQLLKMVGFEPLKGQGAKTFLKAYNLSKDVMLPANQRFMLGDMCFETTKERKLSASKIREVYLKVDGEYKNYSHVIDPEVNVCVPILGESPKANSEIYFVMDSVPEPNEDSIFYVKTDNNLKRNPLTEKEHNRLAKIKWECYTELGFRNMSVKDDSECFLVDGEMRFRMPQEKAIKYYNGTIDGYIIRGTVEYASYDIPPRVEYIEGFLLEVFQKETAASFFSYSKNQEVRVSSERMEQGYYKVLCKEEKQDGYRMYQEVSEEYVVEDERDKGRFFYVEHNDYGEFTIHFDKKRFGYAPQFGKNAVRVIVYNEDIARKYYLGTVLGYDDQEIILPVKNVMTDSFAILAEREAEDGNIIYDFVKPNRKEDGELIYYLFENEGKIRIVDAGEFIGAKLYIAGVATTRGEDGNIRENNTFKPIGRNLKGVVFRNPAKGFGGRSMETLEDTRKRYVQDIKYPYTAVVASDYEKLVKETPGLCIDKVKAYVNSATNTVSVAVKPFTTEKFPMLSKEYMNNLRNRVEQCRLLSTRVEIKNPVYIAVQVHGVIYVKQHYENMNEEIEKVIREELDYIDGDKNFGDVIHFDKLVRKIEAIEGVWQVYDLNLTPHSHNYAEKNGADIVPKDNCLFYPGNIMIEVHTSLN